MRHFQMHGLRTLSSLLIYPWYLLPELISKFSNILLSFIQAESSLVGDVFCARTLNINFKPVPNSKYLHLHSWRKLYLQFNIQSGLNRLNLIINLSYWGSNLKTFIPSNKEVKVFLNFFNDNKTINTHYFPYILRPSLIYRRHLKVFLCDLLLL